MISVKQYFISWIFGCLFACFLGMFTGFSYYLFKNQHEWKKRNIFIENCMKTGQTEALCIDNFYGYKI